MFIVPGTASNIWLTKQLRVDRDYAAFGELSYDITPQLTATAGGRWYKFDNSLVGFFGFSENYSGDKFDDEGNFLGSVSGGCVEGAVVTEALDVIESGKPKTLEFGVADETAWKVGLSCGGTIRVFVEKVD